LKQEIEDIKKQRVVLATAPIKKAPKFDLKKLETDKGFKNIFAKSILEYDYKSAAPTGELLNEIFKEPLQAQKGKPIPSGFEEFNFPESVIEVERSLRE
jgi:hypothetical protein